MRTPPKKRDNRLHISLPPDIAAMVRQIRATYDSLAEPLRPSDAAVVVAAIMAMYDNRCGTTKGTP